MKYCYRICGMFVRFAGGMTTPEFRTKGTGVPSHWAANTCSCTAKSRCSAGKRWSHMVCRRNVMCRVASAEWPIRLAATTSSCNSWICKAGQPCNPSAILLMLTYLLQFHGLYSPQVVRVIVSKKFRYIGHVACTRKWRKEYKLLVIKLHYKIDK